MKIYSYYYPDKNNNRQHIIVYYIDDAGNLFFYIASLPYTVITDDQSSNDAVRPCICLLTPWNSDEVTRYLDQPLPIDTLSYASNLATLGMFNPYNNVNDATEEEINHPHSADGDEADYEPDDDQLYDELNPEHDDRPYDESDSEDGYELFDSESDSEYDSVFNPSLNS